MHDFFTNRIIALFSDEREMCIAGTVVDRHSNDILICKKLFEDSDAPTVYFVVSIDELSFSPFDNNIFDSVEDFRKIFQPNSNETTDDNKKVFKLVPKKKFSLKDDFDDGA